MVTTERWSVALSGGGHRAALYAAGALLYLVDSGLNKEVGTVVSVSGGSLTNGVLAQNRVAFSDMDRASYLAALGPLLERCTYSGTVQWAREVLCWAGAVLVAVLLSLGLIITGCCGAAHPWLWITTGAAIGIIGVPLLLSIRCRVADRVLQRLLFTRDGKPVKLQTTSPDGCPASAVRHIFCASELQSYLHAYFSPRFIYNFNFGVSTDFDLPLSTAVQASSNFPPAFPARRLLVTKLGLKPYRGASRLWLSDGGVYDNMAEEWITGSFDRAPGSSPLSADLVGEPPTKMLVVNASARDDFKKAAGWFRIPLLGEAGVLVQLTNLMHGVTTTSRRNRLIDEFTARRRLAELQLPASDKLQHLEHAIGIPGALTHIGTRADWVHQDHADLTAGAFGTINAAFAALDGDAKDWAAHSFAKSRDLGTNLLKTGEDTAAALLWQGYVLTMVYLHLGQDTLPFSLPSRESLVEILRAARQSAH